MPSAYSSQQKAKIQQFAAFTSAAERVATKYLKSHDWNVEQAADAYFNSGSASAGTNSTGNSQILNKLFDKYRDAPIENPDTISVDGAMKYLSDLKIQLDDIAVLAIGEALQAPTMGEFTREGFVNGWRALNADSLSKQQTTATHLRAAIPTDPALFRRIYRHTFQLARTPGQKAVALDAALEYWRLLFTPPHGCAWSTPGTPWLEWWLEFLQQRWKKSVNRDMWNMTFEFYRRSREDESLAWWDEQGAWPGVVDEFVAFVKERREAGAGEMEVE